jgi:hypothetical protein
MDTLHDRLVELAEDAPTGGAPAADLWARGNRAHRRRAAAIAAAVLVVAAAGTGIGAHFAHGNGDRSGPEPSGTVGFELPVEYPTGEKLPELGETPGPLAAVWVAPREGGGAPEAVGLVAKTGTFGTLPIDVSDDQYGAADPGVALSPDGRMIAYSSPTPSESTPAWAADELIVHDLVSGKNYSPLSPEFGIRGVANHWIDATHLVGHAVTESGGWADDEGWVWEPGTAPKLVDLTAYPGQPYLGYGWPYAGKHLNVLPETRKSCAAPGLVEVPTLDVANPVFEVPVLCDVVGVVDSEILLGHWKSLPGDRNDAEDGNGPVVALDIQGADIPYQDTALRGPSADHAFEDPARRRALVIAGAPQRVAFATDLIGLALGTGGGAS